MVMQNIKIKVLSIALGIMLLTAGCIPKNGVGVVSKSSDIKSSISIDFKKEDLDGSWDEVNASGINLSGDTISVEGKGAVTGKNSVTIQSGGTYSITGTLNDGQIIVDSRDEETVKLVLNGANITNKNNAPIYIKKAGKTIITLAQGTENTIIDGFKYVFEDSSSDEPDAAIYSKGDLVINGEGALTVNANYKNGISSKDDLKITSGNITVNAAEDGIVGKNYIAVNDGNITVNSKIDGMKSNNDEDESKGFVCIANGNIKINSGNDGIQAEKDVLIKDGDISITSGGGSAKATAKGKENMPGRPGMGPGGKGFGGPGMRQSGADQSTDNTNNKNSTNDNGRMPPPDMGQGDDGMNPNQAFMPVDDGSNQSNIAMSGQQSQDGGMKQPGMVQGDSTTSAKKDAQKESCKGIKAGKDITIEKGNITLDTVDDSIHSGGSIVVRTGKMSIKTGDDAIHSEASLEINGGDINVEKCYEGLESAVITINNGNIHIIADDDGINTVKEADGATTGAQMGGGPESPDGSTLKINGGYVYVDGKGDGIDSNGTVEITGGKVISLSTSDIMGDGGMDTNGTFTITGGTILATGNVIASPSKDSKQASLTKNIGSTQNAGTLMQILLNGKEILTFAPAEKYWNVFYSSPDLTTDSTYQINIGGSSDGTSTDGLYSGGTYTAGSTDFTVKAAITPEGLGMSGGPGGRGQRGPGGPGGRRGGMAPGGAAGHGSDVSNQQ